MLGRVPPRIGQGSEYEDPRLEHEGAAARDTADSSGGDVQPNGCGHAGQGSVGRRGVQHPQSTGTSLMLVDV